MNDTETCDNVELLPARREEFHCDVLLVHNPFDPTSDLERRALPYRPEQTVAGYVEALALPGDYILSVNGGVLSRDAWATTALEPGDQLVCCPAIGSGGNMKGILRTIGLVIIAIIATIANVYLEGAITPLVSSLWGMALSSAISTVVTALTPKPKLPDVSGTGDESIAYAWDGPRTYVGPGLPMGIVYGCHVLQGPEAKQLLQRLQERR